MNATREERLILLTHEQEQLCFIPKGHISSPF